MRNAFYIVAATLIPAAAGAKPMVTKMVEGPPNLTLTSSQSVADVQTCLVSRQPGSTIIALPNGGQRVVEKRGIGIVDLHPAEHGSDMEVRAFFINRANTEHWARKCAGSD